MPQSALALLLQQPARIVLVVVASALALSSLLWLSTSPFSLISVLLCVTGLFFAWVVFQFLDVLNVGTPSGAVFLAGFLLRLSLIAVSPPSNQLMDISGHREMGTLVVRGINPYDFNDNPAERQRLRMDGIGYTEFMSQSQEMWNYHAGSQLPLYTFMAGWIEWVWPNPHFHRLFYAFFDSLLGLLLYAFITTLWPATRGPARNGAWVNRLVRGSYFAIPVLLGAFSPILLRSGTLIPSSKGIMILFVLAGVYFSMQPDSFRAARRGGLLLGASVSYMAIGVFAFPLFFANLYTAAKKSGVSVAAVWVTAAVGIGVGTLLWVAPFAPDLVHVVENRSHFGATNAIHASMWRIWAEWTPNWRWLQWGTVGLLGLIGLIGVARRRLDLPLLTGLLFLSFLSLWMIDGSMDRINIGWLVFIALLGVHHPVAARRFTLTTFFGGLLIMAWAVGLWVVRRLLNTPYVPFEVLDSAFNFILYVAVLCYVAWVSLREEPRMVTA